MTQTDSSHPSQSAARCRHTYTNGRRCRLPLRQGQSLFCTRHASLPHDPLDLDDSPETDAALTAGLTEFKSAEPIHEFLSRLLLLLGQQRISPRRAAVLAYIANQLLRTLSAIEQQADREREAQNDGPVRIIFEAPRLACERGEAELDRLDPVRQPEPSSTEPETHQPPQTRA